jgi:hypothetical protein
MSNKKRHLAVTHFPFDQIDISCRQNTNRERHDINKWPDHKKPGGIDKVTSGEPTLGSRCKCDIWHQYSDEEEEIMEGIGRMRLIWERMVEQGAPWDRCCQSSSCAVW